MIQLKLRQGKEKSIDRYHLWIFSGALDNANHSIPEGELVEIVDFKGTFKAIGHYYHGSIAVKILSFKQEIIDQKFWNKKIREAVTLRKRLGLLEDQPTNIVRLVHAEGDNLPGLIIDFYNGTAIIQCHSLGFYKIRQTIVAALQEALGGEIKAIYDKSSETLPSTPTSEFINEYLFGQSVCPLLCTENNNKFNIDWETGQKTGFFIDQRENRKLLAQYSKDKEVLNTFCYSGGFSVYALNAGAKFVTSVDSSAKAIQLVDQNVALIQDGTINHESVKMNTLQYLKEMERGYDIIILDPPAYGKNKHVRHKAIQGYKRLNALAIQKIKPGGILFTFSCSQIVDNLLFKNTIAAAAIEVGRTIKILHQLHQPADHPVNIYHPESEYLKGLVIEVL